MGTDDFSIPNQCVDKLFFKTSIYDLYFKTCLRMPKSFYSPLSFSQICCEENNENSISQRLDLKFSGGGSSLVSSCLFQGLLLNLVLKQRREGWRHVTMVAKFLDHNNRELKQRRRRRQRERQKCHRFLAALLDCDMKLPNVTRPLCMWTQHKNCLFLFST